MKVAVKAAISTIAACPARAERVAHGSRASRSAYCLSSQTS